MKKHLFIAFLFVAAFTYAQPAQDPAALTETGKAFLKQGDYENAVLVFTKALELQPGNPDYSKNLLYTYYLKRDFAKALELGKPLIERENADVQSFQMLGMVYRAIAEDKEAEKLYKRGITKFPNEGVFYSDYGELLLQKQPDEALKLWDKGIEVDPANPNNYYSAAKQYAKKGDITWSLLYGEMFVSMESFTIRTTEIKNMLLEQYKAYYIQHTSAAAKRNLPFTEAVEEMLSRQQSIADTGITPETLIMIRTRFILDWDNQYNNKYPFKLFEHQRQLIQEGLFESYNQWLFGAASNLPVYQTWQEVHQKELNEFLGFIKSKMFKVPEGQHYRKT